MKFFTSLTSISFYHALLERSRAIRNHLSIKCFFKRNVLVEGDSEDVQYNGERFELTFKVTPWVNDLMLLIIPPSSHDLLILKSVARFFLYPLKVKGAIFRESAHLVKTKKKKKKLKRFTFCGKKKPRYLIYTSGCVELNIVCNMPCNYPILVVLMRNYFSYEWHLGMHMLITCYF